MTDTRQTGKERGLKYLSILKPEYPSFFRKPIILTHHMKKHETWNASKIIETKLKSNLSKLELKFKKVIKIENIKLNSKKSNYSNGEFILKRSS